MIGITAKEKGWKLKDMSIEIDKTMTTQSPRRIDSLFIQINMPPHLKTHQSKVLKMAIKECPVLRSLNDSIKIDVQWNKAKRKTETSLNFVPMNIFRETSQVTFFDAGIKDSNGSDVVIHHGNAISPPNDDEFEQFYVHNHQIDHNLVIKGNRTFTLLNPEWAEPHHVIYLNQKMGALQIPIGTYHRSVSGSEGSIVLNQAVRDIDFDSKKEFIPVSLRHRVDLKKAKASDPVYWVWAKGKLKRLKVRRVSKGKGKIKV